ncbi:hypothetical protein POP12_046 [Pectobacterium phage POP12]|nr:hypothetical protein POP12_046 [Pectobacterium phage POP12]
MNKFLFDMDGVLFDWVGKFTEFYDDPIQYTPEQMKVIKAEIAKTDFYLNLEPYPDGFELFEYCRKIGDVAILTSVGQFESEKITEHKKTALIKYLGYLPEFIYTKSSVEKAKYANYGILIDDRVKAVNPFRIAGGKAILFTDKESAIKQIRAL